MPERVWLLMALPRSGTTLLTAMFDVHSRFEAVFEPWNAKVLAGPEDATLDALLGKLDVCRSPGRHLFVKETAVDVRYIDFMGRLHDSVASTLPCSVLLLLRRPAHTFVSEIERRNEWWGDRVSLDEEHFGLWCDRSREAMRGMLSLVRRSQGSVVCYERLAENPGATLGKLSAGVGFEVEARQLEFERHLDTRKVRGDLNVARRPERISAESVRHRAETESLVEALARRSPYRDWFAAISAMHQFTYAHGLCQADDIPQDLLHELTARPASAGGR